MQNSEPIKFLFEPKVFYNESMADSLPDKDAVINHFVSVFYPAYKSLGDRVSKAYKIRLKNMAVFCGAPGSIRKTEDTEKYNEIHTYHNRMCDYYNLLLTACKNRHGIWLNDFIPQPVKKHGKSK